MKVVALEPDPTIAAELVLQVRFFHSPSRTRDRSASLLQARKFTAGIASTWKNFLLHRYELSATLLATDRDAK